MFISGIDSQLGKSDVTFKSNKNKHKIIINDRFILKKLIERGQHYNMYEGVDINEQKYVNIYFKLMSTQNIFNKQIKQDIKNKMCSHSLWSGTHKIQKYTYSVQIQAKYGPSLKTLFSYIKKKISQKDFIHLLYQMIKLVQKIGSSGFVHRQLSPSSVIFGQKPQKNQLYILNVFPMRKKNQQCPRLNTKYCSKGSHLGLNANIKDDLESICYILIDIYSQGKFLKNVKPEQYQSAKTSLEPSNICQNLPSVFLDFYHWVVGMNYTDQVNYFHWKNLILKIISKQIISRPFSFMIAQKTVKQVKDLIKKSDAKQQLQQEQNFNEQKQNIDAKVYKYCLQTQGNSMYLKKME